MTGGDSGLGLASGLVTGFASGLSQGQARQAAQQAAQAKADQQMQLAQMQNEPKWMGGQDLNATIPGMKLDPQAQIPTSFATALVNKAGGIGDPNGQGNSRALAALLKTSGLTTMEANRFSVAPSAISLHNAAMDMYQAYNKLGDKDNPGQIESIIRSTVAKYPEAGSLMTSYYNDPTANIPGMYNQLLRLAAIEQNKISTGSIAPPTEEAIQHNITMYPQIYEQPNIAASKFNQITDANIMPYITGPLGRIALMKDPKTGKMPHPVLDNVYNNLQTKLAEQKNVIKSMNGFGRTGPNKTEMGVPELEGGAQYGKEIQDKISLAQKAVSDQRPPEQGGPSPAALKNAQNILAQYKNPTAQKAPKHGRK